MVVDGRSASMRPTENLLPRRCPWADWIGHLLTGYGCNEIEDSDIAVTVMLGSSQLCSF